MKKIIILVLLCTTFQMRSWDFTPRVVTGTVGSVIALFGGILVASSSDCTNPLARIHHDPVWYAVDSLASCGMFGASSSILAAGVGLCVVAFFGKQRFRPIPTI